MFQGMWPTWAGDDTASAVGSVVPLSSSSIVKRPPVATTMSSVVDDDDEALLSEIGNDDELASHLLVQFPVYGTRNQAQNNNLNQTADWLLGGTSNIPNQQQLLKQQQLQQQQQQVEDESTSLPPPLDEKQQKANETSVEVSQNHRDWDDDEQQLWRNSRLTKLPTNSSKSRVGISPKEETPKEPDPSNDWLMAYYYHTGVTPKFEPRRNELTFEQTTRQDFRSPFAKLAKPNEETNSSLLLSSAEAETTTSRPPTLMSPLNRIAPIEVSEDEDEEEFSGRPPTTTTTTSTRSLTPPGALSADDRQHWMPDRLCNHCYACDSHFTVFRRRHHCRLCGQVFCNTCSGYFVPASQDPSNKTILRTCEMCFDQVTAQQQQKLMEEVEAADAGRKRRKKEEPLSPPEPKQGTPTKAVSPALQEQLEKGDSVLHSLSKKRTESAFTQRRRISQEHAIEQDEKEQTSQILQQQEQRANHETKELPLPVSPKRGESSSTQQSHPSSTSLKSEADRHRAVEEGSVHLGLTAAAHLEQLGDGLLETDAPLLWKELARRYPGDAAKQLHTHWLNKLMSLATRCCATVEPNLKKGDLLDIRPYVKIKGEFCKTIVLRHDVTVNF
jgi:hypothetical protein